MMIIFKIERERQNWLNKNGFGSWSKWDGSRKNGRLKEREGLDQFLSRAKVGDELPSGNFSPVMDSIHSLACCSCSGSRLPSACQRKRGKNHTVRALLNVERKKRLISDGTGRDLCDAVVAARETWTNVSSPRRQPVTSRRRGRRSAASSSWSPFTQRPSVPLFLTLAVCVCVCVCVCACVCEWKADEGCHR